ncbi:MULTISPECIES: PTS sugar transporter subunit IIA [Salinicoccus]|uniref:PTS system glucose-specific EIIA component n=1 Tax=Salinicoccus roseus TaxID=45670 RepID=A0A265E9P7_9STAP|nr:MULTISPECIES: PTS glucose transporter subunit IIA [Salinicoccus]MCC4721659.1 PTS glucose transporter subunit IIA [Salinicoccus sp. RF5]OZT77998.1 PTS glucose transporter subunit IIA [Salinicoccus roseus]RPE54058.1 PTS system IIA component (Glc family) [Salinicoccus roseus]GGA68669.1 PTS system glucose-specific EIIA component [Salinicoccus roseus]
MFKNLFGKKNDVDKEIEITSPLNGKYVKLEDIPDPVFAEKMMGEGFGVDPTDGEVVAPVAGTVMQVFPTNHAVGIKTNNGLEVLIHIGLETVAMEGKGFEGHVSEGDKVEKGDKLVTFDMDLVKSEANSTISPVIITNSDVLDSFDLKEVTDLDRADTVVASASIK